MRLCLRRPPPLSGKASRRFTLESVLITLAAAYYLIFIGIRYVSSMDTFYFRFFEPGSFLFCMGMAGLVLARLKGKRGFGCFGVAAGAVIFLAVLSVFETGGMDDQNAYYEALVRKWDAAYEEIPEKSVIVLMTLISVLPITDRTWWME